MDPKSFFKAPLVPMYTNFEGVARAEKRNFLVKNFQKLPKNAFFACFFFNILPAAQKLARPVFFSPLGELEKSIWSTKKKSTKFSKNFLKSDTPPPPLPPPLEKILDPPLGSGLCEGLILLPPCCKNVQLTIVN